MRIIKIISILTFLLLSNFLFAEIDADVNHAVYYQDGKPYLEVSIHIVGETLSSKKVLDNLVETRANVLITILQGEKIIDFEKFSIVSPKAEKPIDFIDLKRFVINPGTYNIKVEMTDQLNINNNFEFTKKVIINPLEQKLEISPLILLSKIFPSENESNPFYKYGNIMEPVAFNFYFQALDKLIVFAELYNSNLEFSKDFAVKYSVLDNNTIDKEELFAKYKRLSPDSIHILIHSFPIDQLASGNYTLKIDVLNFNQKVILTKTIPFQRSNPLFDKEILMNSDIDLENNFINDLTENDLVYNLKALLPRLPNNDVITVNILMDEENYKGMKFFLYNYWVNYDPVTTEETFNAYNQIAQAVDQKFYSTVGRGFETDRGYIFLKYGKPDNVISVENEPLAPPYEIWFYDRLDLSGENNVRFLFYNPSLGGYDYQLLHSTTRFETQNRQWEVELYSDAPNDITDNRVDATTVKDSYNRRAREYFTDNN